MKITLRAARVNAGLTLEQAAKKAGYSRSALSYWEKGTRSPKLTAVQCLCQLYGINIDDLNTSATDSPNRIESRRR